MNRPPVRSSYDIPLSHRHQQAPTAIPPTSVHPSSHTLYHPSSPSPNPPPQHRDHAPRDYSHPPQIHGTQQRASHLHLPGVATYIEHYHYYNFNGNCTVQQASGDGQPNTIQMMGTSVRQSAPSQQASRPGPGPVQAGGPRVDIPPVPPPMREPLARSARDTPAPHPPSHYSPYREDTVQAVDHDKRPRVSTPGVYATLPISHLPPMSGGLSRPVGLAGPSGLSRQSFLPSARLAKPPVSAAPESRVMHGGGAGAGGAMLPRLRGTFDNAAPISLAPLQTNIPSMNSLHGDDGRNGRGIKRARLSRGGGGGGISGQDVGRGNSGGLLGGGRENENCGNEDRGMQMGRGGQKGYVVDGIMRNANSSSPSHGDYGGGTRGVGVGVGTGGGGGGGGGGNEGFDRNGATNAVSGLRANRSVDESQANDWEVVVEMYRTGKGTEDGVALKMITKGDGRRVSDRKLLEKRRTIGKTYECLGGERFEAAIGYKMENGVRRKQKMYHVISRCRVVNAMRKAGEAIPLEHEKLTCLIDERIAEKEAQKEAGKNGFGSGASGGGNGSGGGGSGIRSGVSATVPGYQSMEDAGRMMTRGHANGRNVVGVGQDGGERVDGGGGSNVRSLNRLSGSGGGSGDGVGGGEDQDGGIQERGRFS